MKPIALVVLAVLLPTCRPLDPDKGTFSCEAAEDCGQGFECRPQAAGGGRCYREGLCAEVELCNGIDDTCDGRVDESFPEEGQRCTTLLPGACAPGQQVCLQGTLLCSPVTMRTPEVCNGIDDDCDGSTDEDFDLSRDSANCGQCRRACGAGTTCRASSCVEAVCDDSTDNDANGATDCDDPACEGAVCDQRSAPTRRCGLAPLVPDGGSDAGVTPPDGGTRPDGGFARGCFFPESACDDALDNDGDGLPDCLDPDCNGRTCFTGQVCTALTCPGPG